MQQEHPAFLQFLLLAAVTPIKVGDGNQTATRCHVAWPPIDSARQRYLQNGIATSCRHNEGFLRRWYRQFNVWIRTTSPQTDTAEGQETLMQCSDVPDFRSCYAHNVWRQLALE